MSQNTESGWFFASQGKSKGPFTWLELVGLAKAETIIAGTMVYHEVFGWRTAQEIPGVLVSKQTEALKPVASVTPSTPATSSISTGSRKRDWKIALGALVVIAAAVLMSFLTEKTDGNHGARNRSNSIASSSTEASDEPERSLTFAEILAEADTLGADSSLREQQTLADKWSYQSSLDPMTSRTIKQAVIRSDNTINLDSPYEGTQHGTLVLRNHPSYGHDVIFYIEQGQLLCPSYSGCRVRVRFDEQSPNLWSAGGPSDNDTTVLFIRNYSGFLQQMRRSEIVRIQPELFQAGAPVFEFHVGGFDNDRYAGQ